MKSKFLVVVMVVLTTQWVAGFARAQSNLSPVVTSQPESETLLSGQSGNFTVGATGTAPLTYQWQFNGTNLVDGGVIAGSATTNLVLMPVTAANAGTYDVIITNAWGSVTSSVVALTINSPPVITVQPVSQFALPGQNVTLGVVATGTPPLYYQWRLNGTNLGGILRYQQGVNTARLFFDPVGATNAGSYDVVITNAWGSVTSSIVTLTVPALPTIIKPPAAQIVSNYLNTVTFTVGATGTGPLTYQWLLNGKYLPNNVITTVAGTNNPQFNYSGDGGPAIRASLNHPSAVVLDGEGNYFIADTLNNRIRKVNPGGSITTVAGNGSPGFNGNGNNATNSALDEPFGVAVDADEDLFIADTYNFRLRLVVYGSLITVAGTGQGENAGDGGAAYNAALNQPHGVAVDEAGNIYIADTYNSCIRKVDVNDVITTVAGRSPGTQSNGQGFSGDGGAATNAQLALPAAVAVDHVGNLFIADTYNNRIRKVSTNGIITTVAGTEFTGYNGNGLAATNAWLYHPAGVAVDGYGQIYIADTLNNRIRKVNVAGIMTTVAGSGLSGFSGDGGSATNANLNQPAAVAVDTAGDLYIADTVNNRIRLVTPAGPALTLTNAGPANAGNYQVIVASAFGSVTSSVASLTVDLPPLITQPPTNQVVLNGGSVTFAATVTGSSPMYYHWQDNGTDVTSGLFLLQGNTTILNLNSATGVNAGNYTVILANAFGSVTSSVATLTITYPPAITNQPASQSIIAGSNAMFSVGGTGTPPLAYQWQFNGINLTDGGNLAGSGTPNLQLTGVADANAGNYTAVITSAWGSVTSSVAGLTVVYTPGITNQPAKQYLLKGGTASFTVAATGTAPLTYQWQFNGTNLFDGTNVSGSAGTNLNLTQVSTTNAGLYDVLIANPWGSVTSSAVTLTIVYPPAITNQPVSQTVVAVNSNSAAFRVGVSGTAPLGYQWMFNGTNLMDGGTISGSAGPSLLLAPVMAGNAGSYAVVITNAWGSVTSRVVSLTVLLPPAITNQPISLTVPGGSNVTFSVGATGTAPLAYQWQLNGLNLPNGIITTVAGNGKSGFLGNGGVATNAEVNYPYGVAVDGQGNRFIVDHNNQQIRKVDVQGVITTVAGTGVQGYSGDGKAATNAYLNSPYGVAVDATGNVFIADTGNQRIRKVDPNGIITTVAGNGAEGYAGDGGAATNTSLYFPYGVAVDASDNLFIADRSSLRIRKVNASGIITTVAGNGVAGFSGDGGAATNSRLNAPTAVAVDGAGNLWIADLSNQRIRKVDANGLITTIAGNGTQGPSSDGLIATNVSLYNPNGVSVDNSGNVYIADTSSQRIRKVDVTGILTTVAGNRLVGFGGDGGAATNATLDYPYGVATDAYGNLYIADTIGERVREVVLQGPVLPVSGAAATNGSNYQVIVSNNYGSVTSSVATLTLLLPPAITQPPVNTSVVIGHNATFSVAATGTSPLAYQWQFNGANVANQNSYHGANGPALTVLNTTALSAGTYNVIVTNVYGSVTSSVVSLTITYPPAITTQPASLVVSNGNTAAFNVGVTGTGPFAYQWQLNGTNLPNNLISTVAGSRSSNFSGDGGPATNAGLNYPYGLAVDAVGNIYIADGSNERIRKVNLNGVITTVAGNGNTGYSGNGLVATNSSLYLFTLYYQNAGGVAVDADNNLFIADTYSDRILVDTYGLLLAVAGAGYASYGGDGGDAYNAALNLPTGLAVDTAGNIYIADSHNSRIRKVDVNDIITTVAGNGTNGYSGDGGAATHASLYYPAAVAVDAFGNLYISDQANQRVRKVDTNGIITTVAGKTGTGFAGDGGAATNASLNSPYGLAVDAYGDLFIADPGNQRIRKVDANGIITTVAGNGLSSFAGDGGSATNASLNHPAGVAVDAAGNIYIADTYNQRIRKVTPQGPVLTVAKAGIGNAGNYRVIITSASGSVTSSVATLTVDVGPAILQQPVSQTIVSGGSVLFGVSVSGTAPLSYQWEFNGTNLNGQTSPGLLLSAVSAANVGVYQALIANAYGSVTSTVANLTVTLPQISFVTGTNGGITLQLVTGPNVSSRVLAATNLIPPVMWLPLYTNVPGPDGTWQFTDTNNAIYPVRFYRTITP